MNRLSWALYWADTLPSLSSFLMLAGCAAVAVFLVRALLSTTDPEKTHRPDEFPLFEKRAEWRSKSVFFLGLVALILANLIPGKETFYAIAASELGEEVLKSPTGDKAIRALDAWLDKQIRDSLGAVEQRLDSQEETPSDQD